MSVVAHQLRNFRGVRENDRRTGYAARKRAVNAADFRLAPGDDPAVQFPYNRIVGSSITCSEIAHPEDCVVMVNGLEMVPQRLAAHRDAMLNEFRRFAQRKRIAFNRVRCVSELNIHDF